MNLVICKYDYFERVNRNLKIVEDDYGNIKINDYAELTEIPFTDGKKEKVLGSPRTKLKFVRDTQPAKFIYLSDYVPKL